MNDTGRLPLLAQVLLTLGCLVLAITLILPFWGDKLNRSLYDTFFRIRGPLNQQSDIVIVGIDDDSFQHLQRQWPWPRSLQGKLLDALTEARARVVVFDVVFDTQAKDPADDRLFAEALSNHAKVVLASALSITRKDTYTKKSWIDPNSSLISDINAIGSIELPIDEDGVVRRAPLYFEGRPTLGYLAAKKFAGDENLQLPLKKENSFLINFIGPRRTIPIVSYYQALDPNEFLPENIFKDKLVFIGSTAELSSSVNTPDHFITPFSKAGASMSGVEIHANVALNLLHGSYIKETSLPVMQIGLVFAFLCGLLFLPISPSKGALVLVMTSGTSILAAYVLFTKAAYFIPLTSFLIPAGTGYLGSVCAHYYQLYASEKRSRRLLEQSQQRIREILAAQQEGVPLTAEKEDTTKVTKVFVSYKHQAEDAGYMAEILDFLKGLRKEGIEFWTDQELRLGERWNQEIKQQLAESDIALVLVSQAYLDSDFCINTEIKSFLEADITIMPIILSPCELERHAWLQERQYLPTNNETLSEHYQDPGKRKRMFLEIRNELRSHAAQLTQPR